MNDQRRLRGLQQEMQRQDIDLVVYGSCPNYQYLTGILADWRMAPDHRPPGDVVLVPRQGEPVLITSGNVDERNCSIRDRRPYDHAGGYPALTDAIIKGFSSKIRRLALGAYLPTAATAAVVKAAGRPEMVDGSHLMDHLRMIKEPEEVEALRAVARLTDEVMLAVVRGIKDGTTQTDLMLEIEMQARRAGASRVSFDPWACFMKSGSPADDQLPNWPKDKGLVADTAITFDVGFVLNGYCSDWGRSVYWGSPPDHVAKAHAALRQSVLETVAGLKDGAMRAREVYPAIEKVLDRLGYGARMRARLASSKVMGHQIGVEVHENPWLKPEYDDMLREGMVMCIEPKLWHPGEYYFRLEEMVYIGRNGAEFLTHFDREMFVL